MQGFLDQAHAFNDKGLRFTALRVSGIATCAPTGSWGYGLEVIIAQQPGSEIGFKTQ